MAAERSFALLPDLWRVQVTSGKRHLLRDIAVSDAHQFKASAAQISDDAVGAYDGRCDPVSRRLRFRISAQQFNWLCPK